MKDSERRQFISLYFHFLYSNQFPPVQVQNQGYIISGPRNTRHFVNPGAHNVSDMKNNHMTNMAHNQIQMVPTHISQRQPTLPHHIRPNAPRNLPRGPFQYQAVYLPGNVAYQGISNHAFYPFSPPQASQTALIMPYVNYPTNQQAKPKETKIKKNNQQENLVKLDANKGIKVDNIIETTTIEQPVIESKTTDILKLQENKENENNNHNSKNEEKESIITKPEEVLQQPEEIQNNGIQHKSVVDDATPKLPSYLDNLSYAEGQWSVTNPTGKKVYSKLFLLQLGNEAVCQKKPDILRNWSNLTNFSSLPQFNSSGGMVLMSQSASATGFMSAYFKPNNSQRGMPIMQPDAKRNSSQGKTLKPNPIHMSLSLRDEVKLNQTENAWVPTTAKKATKSEVSKTKYEEEQKNEENTSVTTLGPNKWSFTTGKKTTFTSSNPYAVLNDDKKSSNSSQIMLKKNTAWKLQFPQPIPSINSSHSQPKDFVEEPVSELDSKIANKIKMICANILYEYEQMQNLDDIIYSLSEDKNSLICTRHEEFVTSMSLIALDNSPITKTTVTGIIFAELLSKKIISMDAITQGIDTVLKDWNDYLIDYPQFFSYIAAIIAPLLLSQNASFDFNNFKDCCTSIRPDNSSIFFTEVLNKIQNSKEAQNIKEQLGGILWIYTKWNASENVTLDVFMPTNQINKYLKKDQFGILILSIVINDKMKLTNNKLLYNVLQIWIFTNISEEIIISPLFVKDLTIAIFIVCLNLNHSYDDFFDHVHLKLLSHFIEFESLPEQEIQAREVQCMYGIQTISATLRHPGGMVLKLFNKLYHHRIISKESFELFIQVYEGE